MERLLTLNRDGTHSEYVLESTEESDLTSTRSRRSTTVSFISAGRELQGAEDTRIVVVVERKDDGCVCCWKGGLREGIYVLSRSADMFGRRTLLRDLGDGRSAKSGGYVWCQLACCITIPATPLPVSVVLSHPGLSG